MDMTPVQLRPSFRERLQAWYPNNCGNSPGDQRQIRIDDQTPDDASDGFCTIQIKVHNSAKGTFTLKVENVPFDDDVEAAVKNLGGTWTENSLGKSFSITLTVESASRVKIMARKIRSVIGRGKQYLNSDWKLMAPRTAGSLEHFARMLSDACRESIRRPLSSTKPK
jgi:hypothetical protein